MGKNDLTTQRLSTDDPKEWVPEKIGTDVDAIVEHVIWQVKSLELGKRDGFIEILRASMRAEARNIAIYGNFSSIVDHHMPLEVTSSDTKKSRAGQTEIEDDYDVWRDRREVVTQELIERGLDRLQQFPVNDFWDSRLWERLTYNSSRDLLNWDAVELLEATLGNMPESERERAVATSLAVRFAQDIVKAEISEDNTTYISMDQDSLTTSRAGEIEELSRILSGFLVAAEGRGMKLYHDTMPLSFSWAERLLNEVRGGNDGLLADLREIVPSIKRALSDDTREVAYRAMAKVLAKHFPSVIIGNLTPATEIVLRDYQVREGNDDSTGKPFPYLLTLVEE